MCVCVCVSCVASIYARVCSSVSCVPLKKNLTKVLIIKQIHEGMMCYCSQLHCLQLSVRKKGAFFTPEPPHPKTSVHVLWGDDWSRKRKADTLLLFIGELLLGLPRPQSWFNVEWALGTQRSRGVVNRSRFSAHTSHVHDHKMRLSKDVLSSQHR